jgi:hypothetical protein
MVSRTGWPKGLKWRPGAARSAVLEAARRILINGYPSPDWSHFEQLAEEVEDHAAVEVYDLLEDETDRSLSVEYVNGLTITGPTIMVHTVALSESPIETSLYSRLALFGHDGYNPLSFTPDWCTQVPPDFGTEWCPQVQFEGHRPDILFRVCFEGADRLLAVECDGHDYHERTAEQALRDRSRDRRLFLSEIHVLRFTGREIFGHPDSCIDDITSTLCRLADELLRRAGKSVGYHRPRLLVAATAPQLRSRRSI